MQLGRNVEEVINADLLKPASRIYASGNAAIPRVRFRQLAAEDRIRDVEVKGVLFRGAAEALFSEDGCRRITPRVIFISRPAASSRPWRPSGA